MESTLIRLRTKDDTNGNPRRAWVRLDDLGRPLDWFEEGYSGGSAVPPEFRESLAVSILEINVTPAEFRKLRRLVEER